MTSAGTVLLVSLVLAVDVAVGTQSASAALVPATANLTGGTLTFTPPGPVTFAGTLNGTDQTLSAPAALDVLDNTGSGAGWNITLTSTTFTAGALTLPLDATSDTAARGVCDAGVTCTLADNAAVAYPVTIPAAAAAPAAIKIQTAAVRSGMIGQTWTHAMHLAVAANTLAGDYTSNWTYSIVSAP